MKLSFEFIKLNRFLAGTDRSSRLKRNIAGSFIIKSLSVGVSFLIVPLSLNYLLPAKYGVWLTLSSIIGWFTLFDIGLGNGLRNRFAEALAAGNRELAKIYVSTTYMVLIIIIIPAMVIFPFANSFLNWAWILNAPAELAPELKTLAVAVFELFCIQFILQLISTILIADQRPAKSALLNLLGNTLGLLLLVILSITSNGSLIKLGIVISISPLVVFLFSHIWYYIHDYKEFAPSLKYFRAKYVKDLMGVGIKFFLIQISAIILYSSGNMLIAHLSGPADVAIYNVCYKYFSASTVAFGIVLMPVWSAVTEAYAKKDNEWVKRLIRKLVHLWFLFSFLIIIMLLISKKFFVIWLGNAIQIPMTLSFCLAIFFIAFNWTMLFIYFLNGVGNILLQLYIGVIDCILFIPLSLALAKLFGSGVLGVVVALTILTSLNAIWTPIQYLKIINNRAAGLWAK